MTFLWGVGASRGSVVQAGVNEEVCSMVGIVVGGGGAGGDHLASAQQDSMSTVAHHLVNHLAGLEAVSVQHFQLVYQSLIIWASDTDVVVVSEVFAAGVAAIVSSDMADKLGGSGDNGKGWRQSWGNVGWPGSEYHHL